MKHYYSMSKNTPGV